MKVPDGNYRVSVTIGSRKKAGETAVRAESRRLFFEPQPTKKGPMVFEIDTSDMLTVISGDDLRYIGVLTGEEAKGTPFEE